MKNSNLLIKGLTKRISGILLLGILLFLPAGTLSYPGAIRMTVILFVPMFFLGAYLYFFDKDLLKKRLNTNEQENQQKLIIPFIW